MPGAPLVMGRALVRQILAVARLLQSLQRRPAQGKLRRQPVELAAMVESHGVQVVDEPLLEGQPFFQQDKSLLRLHGS